MVAGERYYFEVLHKQHADESHLSVAWQINGAARTEIPASQYYSISPHPEDVDDDGLRDSWELQHGFTIDALTSEQLDQLPYADPDHDFVLNFQESQLGTDPRVGQSLPGVLSFESWGNAIEYTLEQTLTHDTAVYREPDVASQLASSTTGPALDAYQANRARGYLIAPTTGEYRFWVSARTSVELLLSTGELPYQKQLLCRLAPEVGTGDGVGWSAYGGGFFWDTFSQQMSSPVYLEAGQKYYLEVLHHVGSSGRSQFSMAWAPPGAERELIPSTAFESFARLPEDWDNDSLPDQWETEHGLNATDNGLEHRLSEGERGDLDGDGLTNREEYLYGTHPNNADTDGDGLTDTDEIRSYQTDPLSSDSIEETLIEEIVVANFSNTTSSWIAVEEGYVSDSFRGEVSWNFNVPADGPWILSLDCRLVGNLLLQEELDVTVSIDGNQVEARTLNFTPDSTTNLRVLTPRLKSGTHQLSLFINNYSARRTLQVIGLQVKKPGGPDLDNSGVADWVEEEMAGPQWSA